MTARCRRLAAQRFEHLAADDAGQQVAGAHVVHRDGAVDLARPRPVAQREQQVRDLAPAVVVERVARQHVSCAASAAAYCSARASVLASVFRSRSLIAIARTLARA
jgi:hypothetical protein